MFCTICGNELEQKSVVNEGDIPFCKKCNKLFFPKVDLAMIAILTNNKNQICLINQNKVSKYKVLIAGFIKPGETLEECVKREIHEEVGLNVTQCNYLNSYHYGNKDILMVGYHAETENYEFLIDENEVDNADWFELDAALDRIREGSIAYLLVKQYLETVELNN